MKKVMLIGDSIRMGYDAYTKEKLQGIAEVKYPEENCRFAEYVLRYFHEWLQRAELPYDEVDVIHWNAGLWDCLHLFDDEAMTPIDVYKGFLVRIMKRIKLLCPQAKVIFATSTPVKKDLAKHPKSFWRRNEEIEAYNRAAKEVLEPFGVEINDLYALLKDVPESYMSDQTHYYTPEATKLVGDQVVAKILHALDLDGAETAAVGEIEKPTDANKIGM